MRTLLAMAVAIIATAPAFAQKRTFADVADLTLTFDPPTAKPGQVVTLKMTIAPKPGCYTYPVNVPKDQLARNKVTTGRLESAGKLTDFAILDPITDPPGAIVKAPEMGEFDQIFKKPATWNLRVAVSPTAPAGKQPVVLYGTRIQACDKDNCIPLTNPSAELEVLAGLADTLPVDAAKFFADTPPKVVPNPETGLKTLEPVKSSHGLVRKAPVSAADHTAGLDSLKSKIDLGGISANESSGGLGPLLLAAAFWGFVSLVTPCVFPMIPITVSLFLKQSHQSPKQVLKLASVYCATIIVVLGSSAVFLLSIFRQLSVDPYMNVFLGGLFVFFALSLFGMYDIALPGFLLRGAEKRRAGGGTLGTVFGAVAFSIVSFTCVAPFLGGFAGMAASGNFSTASLALAGVVFATAFASPFFVLALFPSLLKKLPKSGGWLDTVKAVMGFLELAAAFKFFRTAELRLLDRAEFFTYDVSLSAWVAIAAVTGLYLLNLFRLPHDEEQPNVGVLRMIFGVGFIGLGIYLTPALWKNGTSTQRPGGVVYAWVDAFLLPEPAAAEEELPWGSDLKSALERPSPGKPLIFVDFTGVTCTNCKLNERDVFTQSKVRALLQRYTLVQMYTDDVPAEFYTTQPPAGGRTAEAYANLQFQETLFGTQQLPLYVILEPKPGGGAKVLGIYDEGKINDAAKFAEFLRKPLEGK